MGDDSIDAVILEIDMGYLVILGRARRGRRMPLIVHPVAVGFCDRS
jgi:hypothetical protein